MLRTPRILQNPTRPTRATRAPRSRTRRRVNLALDTTILSRAETVYRRVVDIVAEEIERDLELWIAQNAIPDHLRQDAPRQANTLGFYPGDVDLVVARAQARIGQSFTHSFDAIAEAVDLNSFDKLSRVPGIDASRIVHGGKVAIARYRDANAALIKSVPRTMAADVGNALAAVDVRSLHVSEIGDILSQRFEVSASKAEFWARDQTLKLYADVNEDRHAAAGVTKYEWGGSEDERERGRPGGIWANSPGNHWVLNHTIQLWSAPPVVEPGTGRRAHPGKDYQCRCTAYPHFDGS